MTLAAVIPCRGGHFLLNLSLFHHFAMTLTALDAISCLVGEVLGLFLLRFLLVKRLFVMTNYGKKNEIALILNK
jgi:hypothetical protein